MRHIIVINFPKEVLRAQGNLPISSHIIFCHSYIVLVNLIHFIIRSGNTPGVWKAHFDSYKGINMVIDIQFSLTSLDEEQLVVYAFKNFTKHLDTFNVI